MKIEIEFSNTVKHNDAHIPQYHSKFVALLICWPRWKYGYRTYVVDEDGKYRCIDLSIFHLCFGAKEKVGYE